MTKPKKSVVAKKTVVANDPVVPQEEIALRDKKYSYKVEQNIAITVGRSVRMDLKYPFALMNVGDSFLIPATDKLVKNVTNLHYAAKQYAKFKTGFMITSRLQLDGSRRVWRIK